MALQGRVKADISFDTNSVALDLGSRSAPLTYSILKSITDGTGANQCQKLFSDTRTIAASGNEDLDLAGTGLQDMLNVNLALTAVKVLYVKAADANTNDVVIKGAASNGFLGPFGAAAHTVTLKPGQFFLVTNLTASGWTVTAGTGDLLNVANSSSGSSVSYDIIIAGI